MSVTYTDIAKAKEAEQSRAAILAGLRKEAKAERIAHRAAERETASRIDAIAAQSRSEERETARAKALASGAETVGPYVIKKGRRHAIMYHSDPAIPESEVSFDVLAVVLSGLKVG